MTKISKKGLWFITIIVVVIAAFVTIAVGSNGFTDWSFSKWFTKQEATEPETPDDEDKLNVNGMITEVHNTDEISLRMVSFASENAIASGAADGVRITATVMPEDASDKSVNYSIAWKNPSSTWANNKAVGDYVNMSVSGASATIVGKQPFGEQIIVTCTSVFDETKTATCTVDYAKRLSEIDFHCYSDDVGDVEIDGGYITNETTGTADTKLVFNHEYSVVGMSAYFGIGTVSDTITYTMIFTASDNFVSRYCSGKVPGSYTLTGETVEGITFDEDFLRAVYGTMYKGQANFYYACRENDNVLKVTFTASGNYSSLSGSVNFNFDLTTLAIAVSNVTLDQGNIVL